MSFAALSASLSSRLILFFFLSFDIAGPLLPLIFAVNTAVSYMLYMLYMRIYDRLLLMYTKNALHLQRRRFSTGAGLGQKISALYPVLLRLSPSFQLFGRFGRPVPPF